jgi:hypothetical protein
MKNLHTLNPGHSDPSAYSQIPANSASPIGSFPGGENAANSRSIGLAPDEKPTVRPSTVRRHENLRSLVAELSLRDLGYVGVATHLNCSASCARNYISQLLDLGVIVGSPNKSPAGAADRTVFRLNGVLASSGLYGPEKMRGRSAGRRSLELSQGTLNRKGDSYDWLETAVSLARSAGASPLRDPLVAALFGSPPERVNELDTPG